MDKISYRLSAAADVLDVPESTLVELRDACLVITYRIGDEEFVTDYALRDLQQRLEIGVTAEDCSVGTIAREYVTELVRNTRHSKGILGGTLETPKP
jgi:hypothetical protein